MTNPNDVLPEDVAREFGIWIVDEVMADDSTQFGPAVLSSIGRMTFKRALAIAEQIDFGSEDVK